MKAKKISSNIIISLKDVKSGDLCLGSKKENDRNVELLRAGEQVMSSGGSRGGPPPPLFIDELPLKVTNR